MQELNGNTQGLKPSQKRMLERIFRRRIAPAQLVSPELASFLCECSTETQRQVGIFLDRRGDVTHVIVGDAHKMYLPDVGRLRAGAGRFRGLRLVHTHLRSEPLTRDDLVDLAKLRLDLVAAIGMRPDGTAGELRVAHLLPENPEHQLWREMTPFLANGPNLDKFDFLSFIDNLENEFAGKARLTRAVEGRDRAVLVEVALGKKSSDEIDARVAELKELCRTAGVAVMDAFVQRRPTADPKFLLGKGKLEEIVMRAMQVDANLLVFDPELTPTQARSIADATELKVIDRTMLILDIFAQHATTRDGKLQVELAQLKYTMPRLAEKSTMMSRLTGGPRAGIGGRGPGEVKLEVNRRRARDKIHFLEKQIDELGRRREQRRSLRTSRELPTVAIVGYTNAGKSTLLNALTRGDVLVENLLFATLDPTSRRLRFPREREVIITDTVGFIRDLPADLVNAFRATLEELRDADLLVHVVDAADPAHEAQMAAVERILRELELSDKPRLVVWNKVDRLRDEERASFATSHHGIAVSALDAESTRPLLHAIEAQLWHADKLETGALTDEERP